MSLTARFRLPRKKMSPNRKYLLAATFEGIPAVILTQLLSGPFLTGYLLFLGASSGEIGFVLAITTVVNISQILMAVLMQKFRNRKRIIVIFGSLHRIGWASVGLIPMFFDKEWWVIIYMILYSTAFLSNALAGVVWTSLISDMVPAQVRGRYFGIRNTIHGAIGSVALYVGGVILDHHPGYQGFTYLFVISGICAIWNMFAYMLYPNPPFEGSTESKPLGMIGKPLKDQDFIKAILFLSLWLFLQGTSVPFFNYVMLKLMNISYQWVSIVTVAHTIVMMISYYIWGNLNARFSAKTLLYWSLPMIAAACLLWGTLAFLPGLLVLFLVHILLGIGLGGFNQMVFTFTIGDTPKSERPMYIAVYSALTGFAAFLGPILGGRIYEWLDGTPLWVQEYGLTVLVGLILLVLGLWIGRLVLRDTSISISTRGKRVAGTRNLKG
jgi:MFS family permease